jgi:hypothetical protein
VFAPLSSRILQPVSSCLLSAHACAPGTSNHAPPSKRDNHLCVSDYVVKSGKSWSHTRHKLLHCDRRGNPERRCVVVFSTLQRDCIKQGTFFERARRSQSVFRSVGRQVVRQHGLAADEPVRPLGRFRPHHRGPDVILAGLDFCTGRFVLLQSSSNASFAVHDMQVLQSDGRHSSSSTPCRSVSRSTESVRLLSPTSAPRTLCDAS